VGPAADPPGEVRPAAGPLTRRPGTQPRTCTGAFYVPGAHPAVLPRGPLNVRQPVPPRCTVPSFLLPLVDGDAGRVGFRRSNQLAQIEVAQPGQAEVVDLAEGQATDGAGHGYSPSPMSADTKSGPVGARVVVGIRLPGHCSRRSGRSPGPCGTGTKIA
jgi:hypothetical protein